MASRLLRRAGFAVLASGLGVMAWLLWLEYRNSAEVRAPTVAEERASLERAAGWILGNRDAVLKENNAMLWLFVFRAATLSQDSRLESLVGEYRARYTAGTLLNYFFEPAHTDSVRNANIMLSPDWQDYQRFFVYGATCNIPLRSDPGVMIMLEPTACDGRLQGLRNPWCRTHQLMGLRFVQQNQCEPEAQTTRTLGHVQDGIRSELSWDFRIEDAYLQKVWTLVESGRRSQIKPVWGRRILQAQRADGGWDGVDVILRLPGDYVLCWQAHLLPHVVKTPPDTFHATAQGLYLMALLLNDQL